MHHFLKYDHFHLSVWQGANQHNSCISGCKRCDPILSLDLVRILRTFSVGDEHWSMARDMSHASAIQEPTTGWSIWAGHDPIVVDRRGESRSSQWFSWCCCSSVSRLWWIAASLAQAVLCDMPSPLAMNALPQILLFPIVVSLMISPISLWTFATFTGFTITTFAILLCKEHSFWSGPILSLDCSFLRDELGDNLIRRGGHRGIFVNHELQEDFPLVVPWDPAAEVEDVLSLTDLGDCLCRVYVSSISVSGRWPGAEIVILDLPIDPRCVVVDISAAL